MDKSKNKYAIDKEKMLLYLLSRMQPRDSTKMKLNKLAFFAEFGFKFKTGKDLTNAEYAGIDHGPVINDYRQLLLDMEKKGLIKIIGNTIILQTTQGIQIPKEISSVVDPIIDKYIRLSPSELRALSHKTDSYLITTKGERVMGNIINKELAGLETFFDDDENDDIDEKSLPTFKRESLIPYEFN